MATQPMHFRGSPKPNKEETLEVDASPPPSRGPNRWRDCHATPALSALPDAECGEKLKSGYVTPAFSGAQKRAKLLRNPCILVCPHRQACGENQN